MLSRVASVLKSTFYKFSWLESTWEKLQHSLSTLLIHLRKTYVYFISLLVTISIIEFKFLFLLFIDTYLYPFSYTFSHLNYPYYSKQSKYKITKMAKIGFSSSNIRLHASVKILIHIKLISFNSLKIQNHQED